MRGFLKLIIFIIFALSQNAFVLADAVSINQNDYEKIINSEKNAENYVESEIDRPLYIPKTEENAQTIKVNYYFEEMEQKKLQKQLENEQEEKRQIKKVQKQKIELKKEEPKKEIKEEKVELKKERNLFAHEPKDRVLSESIRKISAIYPLDDVSITNTYPGYRGPNQLVIYNRDFGKTTQTNEFGKEAVVEDDTVVRLTGANSYIPRNGFVISGHGNAKKWINDNLKIGTKVEIQDRTIKAYTTIDSYRFFAKEKIKQVEDILISTKHDYENRDDKYVYYYLKKAKQQLRKSQKDSSDSSLNQAKAAIDSASLAYQYTLPYIENELKGTWIRPTEKSINEIQKTLNRIKDTGINNVFLETYFHGRTIFPSETMKEYGFEEQNPDFDFDVLAVWIKEAHKRGINIHTWFESFYVGNKPPELNPKSILAQRPDWMNRTKQKADFVGYVSHPQEHNGYFLDPANPEVVEFLLKLINEISTRYRVDGINIDYVRYPNISKENYNNQWGYTQFARNEFMQIYEVDPIEIEPKSSLWDNWCEYRRNKITNYISQVHELLRNKNVILSAVIFPDYKVSLKTKHQDWEHWAQKGYLHALTPLILTSDDELAKSMLEEIRKKASDYTLIYPGLFAGFIESDPEDLLKQIHIVRKLKLNGVILFDWAHLNEKYLNVLKTSVFKEKTY